MFDKMTGLMRAIALPRCISRPVSALKAVAISSSPVLCFCDLPQYNNTFCFSSPCPHFLTSEKQSGPINGFINELGFFRWYCGFGGFFRSAAQTKYGLNVRQKLHATRVLAPSHLRPSYFTRSLPVLSCKTGRMTDRKAQTVISSVETWYFAQPVVETWRDVPLIH